MKWVKAAVLGFILQFVIGALFQLGRVLWCGGWHLCPDPIQRMGELAQCNDAALSRAIQATEEAIQGGVLMDSILPIIQSLFAILIMC